MGVPPTVFSASTVTFHPLRSRRAGADSVIIGRMATGQFVEVPPVAVEVIELLRQGHSVGAARSRLLADAGTDIDVAEFAAGLIELGFVDTVDGNPILGPPPPPAAFPRVRPRHVHLLLHRTVALGVLGLSLLAIGFVVARPWLVPGWRALVWHHSGGLVLLGDFALTWSIIYLHELGHLFTARAAGVYSRITLSTRLQFLAAQTDVSGVRAEPRAVRLTVYLAGIAVNLTLASAGILVRAATDPASVAGQVAGLVVLIALLLVPPQLGVFMRTDGYFVAQDLLNCPNLYPEAVAYLRYLTRRCTGDSSAALPIRRRRIVRGYCVFLVMGTAGCLAVAALVSYPALLLLLERAAHELAAGEQVLDALLTIAVIVAVHATWLALWWRRLRRRTDRPDTGGGDFT